MSVNSSLCYGRLHGFDFDVSSISAPSKILSKIASFKFINNGGFKIRPISIGNLISEISLYSNVFGELFCVIADIKMAKIKRILASKNIVVPDTQNGILATKNIELANAGIE